MPLNKSGPYKGSVVREGVIYSKSGERLRNVKWTQEEIDAWNNDSGIEVEDASPEPVKEEKVELKEEGSSKKKSINKSIFRKAKKFLG